MKPEIEDAIKNNNLNVTAVLSGNRNFTGRVHQLTTGNFLGSPMLVMAFALAGTTKINLRTEPLGTDQEGNPVYLRDIWPNQEEIQRNIQKGVTSQTFKDAYDTILDGDEKWKSLKAGKSIQFPWDPESTYIKRPPFFEGFKKGIKKLEDIMGARVLVAASMKVSTDLISPAGAIAKDSPAARYLVGRGVKPIDFNSYGSRRGNDEVMTRGGFGNVKFKNELAQGNDGWWTMNHITGELDTIYDTAMLYKQEGIPAIILGADSYGRGSSRDWASKATQLQGVRAVIVKDFERIHRSNLIGSGVLPLTFKNGEGWKELNIDGSQRFDILGLSEGIEVGKTLNVIAHKRDGSKIEFKVKLRIETPVELDYFLYGGIMPYIVSKELEN